MSNSPNNQLYNIQYYVSKLIQSLDSFQISEGLVEAVL